MADLCMPLLVLNMGGEMIYILQQRLLAQNITPDKQQRVLVDVLNTMYSSKFIAELFKSTSKQYNSSAIRQIFDKLAHSSIMRLNTSSMDKLYDLMCMSVKYQLIHTGYSAAYQLSLINNHVQYMKLIVANNTACAATYDLVHHCSDKVHKQYSTRTPYQWQQIRLNLLRFYQDKKVKISLFLAESIQNIDGNIVVTPDTGCAGTGYRIANAVGSVVYSAQSGKQNTVFEVANAHTRTQIDTQYTDLGTNMYAKDKRKMQRQNSTELVTNAVAEINAANAIQSVSRRGSFDGSADKKPSKLDSADQKQTRHDGAAAELNVLASLLGNNNTDKLNSTELISNLFADDSADTTTDDYVIDMDAKYEFVTLPTQHSTQLNDKMKHLDLSSANNNADTDSGADLLDMMDSVS